MATGARAKAWYVSIDQERRCLLTEETTGYILYRLTSDDELKTFAQEAKIPLGEYGVPVTCD